MSNSHPLILPQKINIVSFERPFPSLRSTLKVEIASVELKFHQRLGSIMSR